MEIKTELPEVYLAHHHTEQSNINYQQGAFDSALGGSSAAEFIFRPPTHFRGARAGGPQEYWQSGAYGIVTVTDGIG